MAQDIPSQYDVDRAHFKDQSTEQLNKVHLDSKDLVSNQTFLVHVIHFLTWVPVI